MPKRRRSKAFWKNFKFKYKLTIVNENTLEEIVGLRVSKLNGLSVLLSVLTVLFLIAACIIAFTPLRNYLPGYMNSEVRSQIVDNALRVDSLQELLNRQNLYIMNIQDIFSGKVPIDSVQTLDSLTTVRKDTLMERTKREEEFRRQYEENEKYNLTTIVSQPDVNGLILYRPTRGMVSDHFNTDKKHFGTDIAANPNESVLATMDGTVFLSTYTAETGDRRTAQSGFRLDLQALRLAAEKRRRPRERRRSHRTGGKQRNAQHRTASPLRTVVQGTSCQPGEVHRVLKPMTRSGIYDYK